MFKYEVFCYYVDKNYRICKHPYLFCETLEEAKEAIKEYWSAVRFFYRKAPKLFIKTLDK